MSVTHLTARRISGVENLASCTLAARMVCVALPPCSGSGALGVLHRRAVDACCCGSTFLIPGVSNDMVCSGPLGRNLSFCLEIVGTYWRCLDRRTTR